MATEKRLIDANALMAYINENHSYAGLPMAAHVCTMELLTYAPTVDAVEVVHGRWVKLPTPRTMWKYRCDKCGCPQDYKHNYCPNCGARMDGDGDG